MDYEKAASYWEEKDANAVKMPVDTLQKEVDKYLGRHKTCALAVASGDFVRCTPIDYNYVDGQFYLFSEGGLKFKALRDNKHVCFAIYDECQQGFHSLYGMQVTGIVDMVEPFCEEYIRILEYKKIPVDMMKKLPSPLNLIKIDPQIIDYLNSDFKKEGYSSRQQLVIERR